VSKIIAKLFLAAALMAAAAASVVGFMSYSRYMDMKAEVDKPEIYKNIFINGVDVGGLSKPDALAKVGKAFMGELSERTVAVVGGGKEFIYKFGEFSPKLEFAKAVEQAHAYAREGTLEERYSRIMALENVPYEITYEPPYSYDPSAVKDKIAVIADHVRVEPKNATIDRKDGEYIITKEEPGTEMDVDGTAEEVKKLLASRQEGAVEALKRSVPAELDVEHVSQAKSLIGSFSTKFSAGANGRNINITNAASKVNNRTLQPGEIFSTNEALGPTTAENGYAPAPVIINGKLEDDLGGGVCQVSSTLYNAVLHAELEIVERTNHSLKVGYLPYAYDATLAGDYLDFKFKNDTDLPVFVEAFISGSELVCNIYGKEIHDPGRTLEFFNEHMETVPPKGETVISDPGLPQGQRVVLTAAKDGVRYNLYKNVYENGVKVSTTQVNSSYYRPVSGEVRVGTGPAAPEEAPPAESVSAGDASSDEAADSARQPSIDSAPAETEPVDAAPSETPAA
jgi:vancomycin resistance protein YoaR